MSEKLFNCWKECLSMLLALQHFDVYLYSTVHPVIVFTDHNPLCTQNEKQKSEINEVEFRIAGS